MKRIDAGYGHIVGLRDRTGNPNAGKPIVVHSYDYMVPRDAPARFLVAPMKGPWLFPVFEKWKISDLGLRQQITARAFDQLAECLKKLETKLPQVHVVNSRDTLDPASADSTGNSGDWLNEIHPNAGGYAKIATKISRELVRRLPPP